MTIKLQYQVTFIRNGHFLSKTEWMDDKDAMIELTDGVNRHLYSLGYRAIIETRGAQSVQPSELKITVEQ